jgi:hypothetical protein
MDTSLSLRVEGWGRDAAGHSSSSTPDRRPRRGQWLIYLIEALESGDMDVARMQFSSLVQADPSLTQHALLARIGAALQSSNLYAAQHFARELRDEGLNAWSAQVHARQNSADHGVTSPLHLGRSPAHPQGPNGIRASDGLHIIDCRA